jgi:uncharacterized coiled-coil protein SlyX
MKVKTTAPSRSGRINDLLIRVIDLELRAAHEDESIKRLEGRIGGAYAGISRLNAAVAKLGHNVIIDKQKANSAARAHKALIEAHIAVRAAGFNPNGPMCASLRAMQEHLKKYS